MLEGGGGKERKFDNKSENYGINEYNFISIVSIDYIVVASPFDSHKILSQWNGISVSFYTKKISKKVESFRGKSWHIQKPQIEKRYFRDRDF